MQIYNPTNSQLSLPFNGQRLTVPSHGVSTNFFGTPEFITLIMETFKPNEIAFIVNGASELAIMSKILGTIDYTYQSLDEAVKKFNGVKEEQPKKEE